MKYFLLLLLFNFLLRSITSQPTPSEDFPHHVILDVHEDVWLYWKIDDIYVTFEVNYQSYISPFTSCLNWMSKFRTRKFVIVRNSRNTR